MDTILLNIYFTATYKIGCLKELKIKTKKQLAFQEQYMHILLFLTWGSNKTSSTSFHQGFDLYCCSKNSQENIHMMTSENAPDKTSNTQSIWLLPMRKASKRSRIQCKYSLKWHPKGSANSFGVSLLNWIFASIWYLLVWNFFFFLLTECPIYGILAYKLIYLSKF